MTAGHKHRFVGTTSTSWLFRVLTRTIVWRTRNTAAADRSRFVYKPGPTPDGYWVMSLLGFLHPLTGLVLDVTDLPAEEDPQ